MAAPLTKVVEVMTLANRLLAEHGLTEQGWTFDFDNAKSRIGECRHYEKEIGYSLSFVEHTPMAEIENTIRHEIAHALTDYSDPETKSHGYEWREMAIRVGAKPKACGDGRVNVTNAKYNYVMECPSCGQKWYRYRMRQRNFGGKCSTCKVEVDIYSLIH